MKKYSGLFLVAIIAATAFFTSCDKLQNLTSITFGYTYKQDTLMVPELPGAGDMDITLKLISTNINDILASNGVDKDKFTSAKIKSISLEMIDTTTIATPYNFNILSKCSLSIKADGLAKKVVASIDPIPAGVNTINLDVNDIELQKYFDKDNLEVTVSGTLTQPTTHSIRIHPVIRVEFTGDVLK